MGRLSNIVTIDSLLLDLTVVGAVLALGLYLYQKYTEPPKQWVAVGRVKRLCIYPLKSGHRIELNKAICTDIGVEIPKNGNTFQLRDRMFVVYKEGTNKFRTARNYPKLVNVSLTVIDENYVQLDGLHETKLKFKIPNTKEASKITLTLHFNEKIPMFDCGNEPAEWISMCILNKLNGLRLGFSDCSERRNLKSTHQKYLSTYKNLGSKATGIYSDFTSYNILNQSSVDDLHLKIKTDNITVDNFRPNILVESISGVPYEEDNWEAVKIGNVEFCYVMPCYRCSITTIDLVKAIKSPNTEPLKTLRTYRQLKDIKQIELDGSYGVMGVNVGLKNGNGQEISVGDTIYAKTF